MARIRYREYEIEVWVELYDPDFPDDPSWADVFDTVKEARRHQREWPATRGCGIRWACAEIISRDGDVNPAVRGATRGEALKRLKRILYPPKKK